MTLLLQKYRDALCGNLNANAKGVVFTKAGNNYSREQGYFLKNVCVVWLIEYKHRFKKIM